MQIAKSPPDFGIEFPVASAAAGRFVMTHRKNCCSASG
jgi:hypothetical protein